MEFVLNSRIIESEKKDEIKNAGNYQQDEGGRPNLKEYNLKTSWIWITLEPAKGWLWRSPKKSGHQFTFELVGT